MQLEAGLTPVGIRHGAGADRPHTTADELRHLLVVAGVSNWSLPQRSAGYTAAATGSPLRRQFAGDLRTIGRNRQRDRLIRVGGVDDLCGKRLKILAAVLDDTETARGTLVAGLRLVTVQPEGKAAMSIDAFARGVRMQPDEFFE